MKKKTEKAYFNEQWGEMTTHLKAFIKDGDQEELHLFRVRVKKLRAMLTLLDAGSQKRKLSKDFKPVRNIFKHGGIIRNAYINLQLGAHYHLNNEQFVNSQQFIMENGINEFKQMGQKYQNTIKTAHATLKDDLKAVNNDCIIQFYKTQMVQIANSFDHLQFDDNLHNCRKQIKILVYNNKIAHKALDGKLLVNNDYLDKLQDNIGNWHDTMLALELFSSPELNDKVVITKIKRQNTRLKRTIAVLTQNFWERAVSTEKTLSEDQK
jgi:CHAD domain-containing protein